MLKHRVNTRLHLPRISAVERVMQSVEFAQRGVARMRADIVARLMIPRQQQSGVAKSLGDNIKRRTIHIVGNFLLQSRHRHTRLAYDFSAVGRNRTVEEFHDRTLARAIAAEQAHAFAPLDGKSGAIKNWWTTESDADVLHAQEGHGLLVKDLFESCWLCVR